MPYVKDPKLDVLTPVTRCRSCQALVYWSLTDANRKRAPFDVDAEGNPTRVSHFSTCPDARRWSRKARA